MENKEQLRIDINKITANDKINMFICGGCGLYPCGIGASYELNKLILTKTTKSNIVYSALSSGCFPALLLALDVSEPDAVDFFHYFTNLFDVWYKSSLTHHYENSEKLLRKILPKNARRILNGKLFIRITTWSWNNGFQSRVISNYKNNEDIINVIICSCHLVIFGKQWMMEYNGEYAFDGGILGSNIDLKNHINLVIKYSDMKYLKSTDRIMSTCFDKFMALKNIGKNYISNIEYDTYSSMNTTYNFLYITILLIIFVLVAII